MLPEEAAGAVDGAAQHLPSALQQGTKGCARPHTAYHPTDQVPQPAARALLRGLSVMKPHASILPGVDVTRAGEARVSKYHV